MKKRFVILTMVLCMFVLCSCKSNNKNDLSDKETVIGSETTTHIVEDEITLDYGQEEQKSAEEQTNVVEREEVIEPNTTEASDSSQQVKEDELENHKQQQTGDNADKNVTEPKNPYDKDGDGYVDGWY